MSRFAFTPADAEAEQFCWKIVRALMRSGLSKSEALRQLNAFWKGQIVGGKEDYHWIVYHLDADEWAARILQRRSQTRQAP